MKGPQMGDQERGADGVVCSLLALSNGKLRVVMDDVSNSGLPEQGPWLHRHLVTWKDYELNALKDLESLPESELAAFGHYVLARLLAARNAPS